MSRRLEVREVGAPRLGLVRFLLLGSLSTLLARFALFRRRGASSELESVEVPVTRSRLSLELVFEELD